MTEAEVRARVRVFLVENFLYMRPDFVFGDEDPLLKKGVMDSLGVMEVVAFLEETWGLSVPTEDVTEEHMGSIAGIGRYVISRAVEHA